MVQPTGIVQVASASVPQTVTVAWYETMSGDFGIFCKIFLF